MANREHLKKLKEGIEAWNKWRRENPGIVPDLSGADLRGTALTGINLSETDLEKASLIRAHLVGADLIRADFAGSDLSEANLREANLSRTDLIDSKLSRADLSGAMLWYTTFVKCIVDEVSFADCSMVSTTFAGMDLSRVKGLDDVRHYGPSTIGIDTIYKSQGKIPDVFLRGAGVPENFITYQRSLAAEPFDYYSCFISYSSKDHDFAERLHSDMQSKGVRCWFAPEDLKTGDKFRQRIDEAIRIYDKLLVVLSENSIESPWVEEEVEGALEKERRENSLVLFPVRLDGAVMEANQAWAASLRRTRHIADFTKWKEHDHYQTVFQRLLRDLQGKNVKSAGGEA